MKVVHTGASSGPGQRRRVGSGSDSSGSNDFGRHVAASGTRPTGLAPAGPLTALSSVLAVQAAPSGAAERERAVRRGLRLLDELDELHAALLEDRPATAAIGRLSALLGDARPAIDDPELQAALDQIELRAAVELAKRRPD